MDIIRNFPCISIMLCLFAGIVSSGLRDKAAMWINTLLLTINIALSICTLLYTLLTGEPFVYVMGKFPAPWGNEIRAGILEALLALFFCVIMLLSLFGGRHKLLEEVEEGKTYLYYVLSDLHQRYVYGICIRGDQHDIGMRADYDPPERPHDRSCRQIYDHEPVRFRSAAAWPVYAL